MSATKPVLQAAIQQYAKQLRVPTLGDQFARLADEAEKEKQSHLSYLEALLEAEVEERDHRAMARRIEEDLVDQLFNSSEKRLARVLLLLANCGKENKPEPVIPKIGQQMLAEII